MINSYDNKISAMINNLGHDADLLTRSDEWLQAAREAITQKLNQSANELRAVMLAQNVKKLLQQRNLVAIQHLLRNESGEVVDIIIRIIDLPDALKQLDCPQDYLDNLNRSVQINNWEEDGYDIDGSAALR